MIKSINIKNLFSFGPDGTPELKDFKQFNLFIGKNGSGKSNVWKVLKLDESDYSKHKNVYTSSTIPPSVEINPSIEKSNILSFTDFKLLKEYQAERENLETVKNNNTTRKGSFDEIYRKKLPYIVNVGLSYIFELHLDYKEHENTDNLRVKESIHRGMDGDRKGIPIDEMFSGFKYALTILRKLVFESVENKIFSVVFIDEPENHLEPRAVRRFIQYLFWLFLDNENKQLISDVQKYADDPKSIPENCASLEGNEHIRRGAFPHEICTGKQLFIASHSSALINEFIKNNQFSNIYEFERREVWKNDNKFCTLAEKQDFFTDHLGNNRRKNDDAIVFQSHITHKSTKNLHSILQNLGTKGSDILQTNGIIWVEGPSDRTYINYWLQKFFPDSGFVEGQYYSVMFYGGKLLSHLTGNQYEWDDELVKEFIELPKMNQKMAIIIDSDKKWENAQIRDTKTRIKNEFEKNKAFVWITDGREIENYLDPVKAKQLAESVKTRNCKLINSKFEIFDNWLNIENKNGKKSAISKTEFAKKIQEKGIGINPNLEKNFTQQIQTLHTQIQSWNQ